jgi:hypothetical protein
MANYSDQLVAVSNGSIKRITASDSITLTASSLSMTSGNLRLVEGDVILESGSLSISGDVVTSGNSTASGGSFSGNVTIGGTLEVTGNTTLNGDLTVNGTTTSVQSQTLEVKDAFIKVGDGNVLASTGKDLGLLFSIGDGASEDQDNRAVFWDSSESEFAIADVDTFSATSFSAGDPTVVEYSPLRALALRAGASADTEVVFDASGISSAASLSLSSSAGSVDLSSATTMELASTGAMHINGTAAVTLTAGAGLDINVTGSITADATTSIDLNSTTTTTIDSTGDMTLSTGADLIVASTASVGVTAGSSMSLTADADISVSSSSGFIIADVVGAGISWNGIKSSSTSIAAGMVLQVASDGTNTYVEESTGQNMPIGISLAAVTGLTGGVYSNGAIKLHTFRGLPAPLYMGASAPTKSNNGSIVYLDNSNSHGTLTAPTSGVIYRLGVLTGADGVTTTPEVLWDPEFIADLT